jgi:hypothetical protein
MVEREKELLLVIINSLISRTGGHGNLVAPPHGNLVALRSVDNRPNCKVIHGNLVPWVTVTWSRPRRILAERSAVTWSHKPIVRIILYLTSCSWSRNSVDKAVKMAFRMMAKLSTSYSAQGRPRSGGIGEGATQPARNQSSHSTGLVMAPFADTRT